MLLIFSFGPNFIKVAEVTFYNTSRFCPYPLCHLGVKRVGVNNMKEGQKNDQD